MNQSALNNSTVTAVAYLPCGKLITAIKNKLVIWDFTANKGVFSNLFTPLRPVRVAEIEVSPDPRSETAYIAALNDGRIVTVSYNGNVNVFTYNQPELENQVSTGCTIL